MINMLRPEIREQVNQIIPEFSESFGWSEFRSKVIETGFKPYVEVSRRLVDMRVKNEEPSWRTSYSGAVTIERALALEGRHHEYGTFRRDRSKKIAFEGNKFDLSKLTKGEVKFYLDVHNEYVVDVMQKLTEMLPPHILERIRISTNLEELNGSENHSSPSNLVIDSSFVGVDECVVEVVRAVQDIRKTNDRYFPEPEKSIPDMVTSLKLPIDQNVGVVEMSSSNSFDTLERNFMLANILGDIPSNLTFKEKLTSMIQFFGKLSKTTPGLFQDQNLLNRRRMYLPPIIF